MKIFDHDCILITGITGSGKSSLLRELLEIYDDKLILQKKYTTRPKRRYTETEKLDEYEYVSKDDIMSRYIRGELVHISNIKAACGDTWLYGFQEYSKSKGGRTYIQIVGPKDISEMCKANTLHNVIHDNSMIIILYADKPSTHTKLLERNDNIESSRRYKNDALLLFGSNYCDGQNSMNGFVGKKLYELGVQSFKTNKRITIVEVYNDSYGMSSKDIAQSIAILLDNMTASDNFIKITPEISCITNLNIKRFNTSDILKQNFDKNL